MDDLKQTKIKIHKDMIAALESLPEDEILLKPILPCCTSADPAKWLHGILSNSVSTIEK